MHMLVSMYYCIYMFSYGPYGPEIKHYYYYYYYYYYRIGQVIFKWFFFAKSCFVLNVCKVVIFLVLWIFSVYFLIWEKVPVL